MKTLTYTSFLGIFCLLLEAILITFNMASWRKYIASFVAMALIGIFAVNFQEWGNTQSYFHDMIQSDNFGIAFSGLLIAITTLIVLMSNYFYQHQESKLTDFIAIKIFALCGALAMVTFGNMAMFFIGLEILSVSLYILAASDKGNIRSNEAGMKYFLMGAFASGILLFGITLIYGVTGTFNLAEIASFSFQENVNSLYYLGVVMILIALLFKASAFPFHFWAADVYEGAPTLTTTFMASVGKIAAIAALYRLFSVAFPTYTGSFGVVLSIVIALTILVGNFMALNQDSFKRMLAFSGISHAGFMLMTILCMKDAAANDLLYYTTAYAVSLVGAFAVAIIVFNSTKSELTSAFNGLGKKQPVLAVALTLFMFSMAGIPPFAGFLGKYFVFVSAIKSGYLWLTIFAIINSIVAIYYYFKVVFAMWATEPNAEEIDNNLLYKALAIVCLFIVLAIGIFPSFITKL